MGLGGGRGGPEQGEGRREGRQRGENRRERAGRKLRWGRKTARVTFSTQRPPPSPPLPPAIPPLPTLSQPPSCDALPAIATLTGATEFPRHRLPLYSPPPSLPCYFTLLPFIANAPALANLKSLAVKVLHIASLAARLVGVIVRLSPVIPAAIATPIPVTSCDFAAVPSVHALCSVGPAAF